MMGGRGVEQLALVLLLLCASLASGLCPNACNWNGNCLGGGRCSCFPGWQGNDCGTRSCPAGPNLADIAYAKDSAHVPVECSGRGECERATGNCICETGWSGNSCNKSPCMNDCSGRGQCMSLAEAALTYDGYLFNHTSNYALWDAGIMMGCKCDAGYSGADCSERVCEYGLDPRASTGSPRETVTLVCKSTTGTVGGKFKLRHLGQATKSWLYPTSKAWEVAKALTVTYGNISIHSVEPVSAYNRTANDAVCGTKAGEVRRTHILFRRTPGRLPPVSFYANLITSGQLYFETTQILTCDCTTRACNGTFRVSFDGQISNRMSTYTDGSQVISALKSMSTIASAGIFSIEGPNSPIPTSSGPTARPTTTPISNPTTSPSALPSTAPTPEPIALPTMHPTPAANSPTAKPTPEPTLFPAYVSMLESTPICRVGMVTNHTFVFAGSAGNFPRLGLLTSVVPIKEPVTFKSVNATSILTIKTSGGRDDDVKLCNGVGQCDFSTGVCQCPNGFGLDPDLGPCAKLIPPTSKFNGVGSCPGLVSIDGSFSDGSKVEQSFTTPAYTPRVYMSQNPIVNTFKSSIVFFEWNTSPTEFPAVTSNRILLFYMKTSASAGPLVLDQAKDRIFFVDAYANSASETFIGIATVNSSFNASAPYTIWIRPKCRIFGLAFNAKFNQRILYWTCPGTNDVADGGVYYAYIDDTTGNIYNLGASISSSYTFPDPMGIAFNYLDSKIYWLDKSTASSTSLNVLNSCKVDGSSFVQSQIPLNVDGHFLSRNLTDLIIDISGNNTAYFIDASGSNSAIVGVTIGKQNINNVTLDANMKLFEYMESSRLLNESEPTFASPQYLAIDKSNNIVMWTDSSLRTISFTSIITRDMAPLNNTVLYTSVTQDAQYPTAAFTKPVGILIDFGLGSAVPPGFVECYGNGKCLGAAGNYTCQCFDGFFGDCQARMCPKGNAWFHQPFLDNIAHDVISECSSAGTCNRATGVCTCNVGFEGAACERMMCLGQSDLGYHCGGNGRCLSMREMAKKHKSRSLASSPVNYGSSPNNPSTWDADMIFGCVGDEYGYFPGTLSNVTSFQGYKSSFRECPYGFDQRELDILSTNQTKNILLYQQNATSPSFRKEVQQFVCASSSGSFSVSFRGFTSALIAASATTNAFISALTGIPAIGNVNVTMSSASNTTGRICGSTGANLGYIEFSTELGYTPLLTVASSSLSGKISFTMLLKGKGMLLECSGHGNCDRNTGECQCYDTYGSSNGYGGFGIRADCGRAIES